MNEADRGCLVFECSGVLNGPFVKATSLDMDAIKRRAKLVAAAAGKTTRLIKCAVKSLKDDYTIYCP